MNGRNKLIVILRWIVFIPGAFLGAWVGWIMISFAGRISMLYFGGDPDSFISQLYFNTAGNLAMGAAFVYVGSIIAPKMRKTIAYILSVLGLVSGGGFLLFFSVFTSDAWAIWGCISLLFGIILIMYYILKEQVDLD